MKITRDIIDNGKRIIHVQFEKEDIDQMKKHSAELEAQRKQKEQQAGQS